MCQCRSICCISKASMSDNQFYSRATGKLSNPTYGSLTDIKKSKKDGSTIYSIENDKDDSHQYPLDTLTTTQVKYIQDFIRTLCNDDNIEIDPYVRGIHWVGMWYIKSDNVTISCSTSQPHITNCVISPRNLSYDVVKRHSKEFFESRDRGYPTVRRTTTSCQLLGKYSIPLMDSLIEHGLVRSGAVHWSNVIIGQTQPIFVVVSTNDTYECTLTFNSCLVLDEASSNNVNITHPTSGTLNFAFRSSNVANRDGEGGYMTVHGSGIIQCQGNPIYIKETMASFRECLMSAMKPKYALRFIKSLNVVRKI